MMIQRMFMTPPTIIDARHSSHKSGDRRQTQGGRVERSTGISVHVCWERAAD
jgi:hypothetical protein